MKKAKTILVRGVFYLIALQILNTSIDIDYIAATGTGILAPVPANFDDMDSFFEFLVEGVLDDDNYTSEDDDDRGDPHEKGLEKYSSGPFCFEQYAKPFIDYQLAQESTWSSGIDHANKVCKGYFSIFSPPPDMA